MFFRKAAKPLINFVNPLSKASILSSLITPNPLSKSPNRLIPSRAKGYTRSKFADLFKILFKKSASDEVSVSVPKKLRARPMFGIPYAAIYVDATCINKSKRLVRVAIVGRSREGRLLFAKTCIVDSQTLIPGYTASFYCMVLAENTAFIYGTLTAIEYGVRSYDIINDNIPVQDILKKKSNIYKRSDLHFLAISAKKLWFDSNAPGFGKVGHVDTADNYCADLLSRWKPSSQPRFLSYIKYDLSHFEATTKTILASKDATLVVRGKNFDDEVNKVKAIIEANI